MIKRRNNQMETSLKWRIGSTVIFKAELSHHPLHFTLIFHPHRMQRMTSLFWENHREENHLFKTLPCRESLSLRMNGEPWSRGLERMLSIAMMVNLMLPMMATLPRRMGNRPDKLVFIREISLILSSLLFKMRSDNSRIPAVTFKKHTLVTRARALTLLAAETVSTSTRRLSGNPELRGISPRSIF